MRQEQIMERRLWMRWRNAKQETKATLKEFARKIHKTSMKRSLTYKSRRGWSSLPVKERQRKYKEVHDENLRRHTKLFEHYRNNAWLFERFTSVKK